MSRILLVDDEDDIRLVASTSLRRVGGHEVETASSGDEALTLLGAQHFDAVLLDVQMPERDGRATLQAIRDAGHDVDVVFLTAQVQHDDRAALEALDVRGVLSKPFDPMTLPATLAELLHW
jgi:CheY-like chemotaxis protein